MKKMYKIRARFTEKCAPAIVELDRLAQSKNAYDIAKYEKFSAMYEMAKFIADYADSVTALLDQTEAVLSHLFDGERRKSIQEDSKALRELYAVLKAKYPSGMPPAMKELFFEIANSHAEQRKEQEL